MSDDPETATTLSLVHGARWLAALEAAQAAAGRATSEQREARAALARQHGELEAVQVSGQKLGTRSRDILSSLQLVRESVDRAKLTALNAGLEGARLGDSIGRALLVMGDEVRNLLARAVDALAEHAGLLAEVDRDRDRTLAELAQLGEGARQVGSALNRAQDQSQLTSALLAELTTDVSQQFGGSLEAVRALAKSSQQVEALATSLLELKRRSPASGAALRELLSPLLALLPPTEGPAR